MNKMTPQQIRAAAAQAAATVVGPGGSTEDVMKTADVIGGYIARGSDLVPADDAWQDPTAQAIAEMAMKCTRRVEVEFLQRMADEMYRLQVVVRLGEGYGTLEECLRHYWKSLPA